MASVFLSYDRDDAARARYFAQALEKAGHEVWWDLHVRGGAQFSKVIEEALKAADAVVVLWSRHSVDSAWVRDEAAAGRDTGRLVPVTIDGTTPPLGFRQFQTIDLAQWKGRGRPAQLQALLNDVNATGRGAKASLPSADHIEHSSQWNQKLVRVLASIVAVVLVAAILAWWKPWAGASLPTVAVTAAGSDQESQALARDLVAKLGSLQSGGSASIRILSDARTSQPNLLLEVGSLAEPSAAGAHVVLAAASDRTILWSKEFEQGTGNLADLKQQIAYSATRVLGCAGEALTAVGRPLRQEDLKLYLSACSKSSEGTFEPRGNIAVLSQIVRRAPRFQSAWRKLLLADAELIRLEHEFYATSSDHRLVRAHIAAARKLDPNMAEATLAEIALVPAPDFVTKLRLIDKAKDSSPDNPIVLSARSDLLRSVGRMRDAVYDAQRAAELDPLSPAMQAVYFSSVLYAGDVDSAREELAQAERLWPGSSTARDMQFRFHARYGDPKLALQFARAYGSVDEGMIRYLKTRADRRPANVDRLLSYVMHRTEITPGRLGFIMQAFSEFGRIDELYEIMMRWPRQSDFVSLEDIWFRPSLENFRKDPRFLRAAARSPLIRYWRTTGKWPDFCIQPGLPYDCKKEAAKLLA